MMGTAYFFKAASNCGYIIKPEKIYCAVTAIAPWHATASNHGLL